MGEVVGGFCSRHSELVRASVVRRMDRLVQVQRIFLTGQLPGVVTVREV